MEMVYLDCVSIKEDDTYGGLDVFVQDSTNDYQGFLNCHDLDNYIECLYLIQEKGGYVDSTRTDVFIDKNCKDILEHYRGNWVMHDRIPIIIKAMEMFKEINGLGKIYKDDLLKNINEMNINRLYNLVSAIKRKEKANETSRN